MLFLSSPTLSSLMSVLDACPTVAHQLGCRRTKENAHVTIQIESSAEIQLLLDRRAGSGARCACPPSARSRTPTAEPLHRPAIARPVRTALPAHRASTTHLEPGSGT